MIVVRFYMVNSNIKDDRQQRPTFRCAWPHGPPAGGLPLVALVALGLFGLSQDHLSCCSFRINKGQHEDIHIDYLITGTSSCGNLDIQWFLASRFCHLFLTVDNWYATKIVTNQLWISSFHVEQLCFFPPLPSLEDWFDLKQWTNQNSGYCNL